MVRWGSELSITTDWLPSAKNIFLDNQVARSEALEVWSGCHVQLLLRRGGAAGAPGGHARRASSPTGMSSDDYVLRISSVEMRAFQMWGRCCLRHRCDEKLDKVFSFGTRSQPTLYPTPETGLYQVGRKFTLTQEERAAFTDADGALRVTTRLTFCSRLTENTHMPSYTYAW